MITATDDANYNDAGIYYKGVEKKTVKKLAASIKITPNNASPIMLTAKSIFNGKEYNGTTIAVPRGYLTSIDLTSDLSKFADDEDFTMLPYFITLDGVKVEQGETPGVSVYGVTNRTVNVGNKCFQNNSAPGIAVTDAPVDKIRYE
jgi:hypothetical protein